MNSWGPACIRHPRPAGPLPAAIAAQHPGARGRPRTSSRSASGCHSTWLGASQTALVCTGQVLRTHDRQLGELPHWSHPTGSLWPCGVYVLSTWAPLLLAFPWDGSQAQGHCQAGLQVCDQLPLRGGQRVVSADLVDLARARKVSVSGSLVCLLEVSRRPFGDCSSS